MLARRTRMLAWRACMLARAHIHRTLSVCCILPVGLPPFLPPSPPAAPPRSRGGWEGGRRLLGGERRGRARGDGGGGGGGDAERHLRRLRHVGAEERLAEGRLATRDATPAAQLLDRLEEQLAARRWRHPAADSDTSVPAAHTPKPHTQTPTPSVREIRKSNRRHSLLVQNLVCVIRMETMAEMADGYENDIVHKRRDIIQLTKNS